MDVKIFTDLIDDKARYQINDIAKIYDKEQIRIMPDVHPGIGSVIGFTCQINEESKIVPNIVGVDIGCSVHGYNLGDINVDLETLDNFIRENIPHGFRVNNDIQIEFNLEKLNCYPYLTKIPRLKRSIGSLGSGNHFIEIDQSENGDKWLIVHSGSRNLGNQVAKFYQNMAYEEMKYNRKYELAEVIKNIAPSEREEAIKNLPKEKIKKDTAYLNYDSSKLYLQDMDITTMFAYHNRVSILDRITKFLGAIVKEQILSVHNYIDIENMIIRKGAIQADEDQLVLIPINMRDGVIIGRGLGNEDWNNSAPHGAGRLMGRGEAKRTLDMEEFKDSMKDIYTTSVNEDTLDEAPMVYKPIEAIIDNIKDAVEIIEILKPIYNFKSN